MGRFFQVTKEFLVAPDILCTNCFGLLLLASSFVYQVDLNFNSAAIVYPLAVFVILILLGIRSHFTSSKNGRANRHEGLKTTVGRLVRDWMPMVFLLFIYENLHDLTNNIRPETVDASLMAMDEAIFGVEPTLALQTWITPWLSELMTIAYGLYFFYPMLLLTLLYLQGDRQLFRELFFAITLCFYLGFVGYLLVPAVGPRYFIASEFQTPIQGIWLTERAAAVWNAFESVKRDCFPSLHTAITSLALIYMVRLRRRLPKGGVILWVSMPWVLLLWLSTIYLRYHWMVDLIAGWLLALFCCFLAPWVFAFYQKRKGWTV